MLSRFALLSVLIYTLDDDALFWIDRVVCHRSLYDETEVDELRLSDDGVDDSDVAAEGLWFTAAAGLQCAQMNMVNPRPLQLLQMEFLKTVSVDRLDIDGKTHLGAFPAQLRHVRTVLPPMQDRWVGSSARDEVGLPILMYRSLVEAGRFWNV